MFRKETADTQTRERGKLVIRVLNTFYQQLTHWFYYILQPDAFRPLQGHLQWLL
jgi:hypothetical protein